MWRSSIASGKVVLGVRDGKEVILSVRGDAIGELALLDEDPRCALGAGARPLTPVTRAV